MLLRILQKLKLVAPFFRNRRRFLFERLSQESFSKSILGFTFRNSKWYNYFKTNINKLPLQNIKRAVSTIFLALFLILLVNTLLENITYGLLANLIIQIKSLAVLLVATLQILPNSILALFTKLWEYILSRWLAYTDSLSPKLLVLRFQNAFQKLRSVDFSRNTDNNSILTEKIITFLLNSEPDNKHAARALFFARSYYLWIETLRKLNHSASIRSLRILVRREPFGVYNVSASDAELKILEIASNVRRAELSMENDKKYKWELRDICDVMLDPTYLPIQMCKEAGLDDRIITILTSSEYEDITPSLNTPEINSVSKIAEDSANLTKTQRVLSKNTILHNQSVKSMNWITNTKKLVTDFASTFDATRNNIWISNNLTKNSGMRDFTKNIKHIYGDYSTVNKKQSEQEILRNHSHNNSSSNIDFIKYYEESFFWVLKQMSYFGTLDAELSKVNVEVNRTPSGEDSELVEYLKLFAKLNNVYMFLKDESLLDDIDEGYRQLARDIFYQSPNKELFTRENLIMMSEIINNKTDADSRPYFFKLSTYDMLYETFPEVQDFTTDWEETRKFIKQQPSPCPHVIDIIEREYLKDCYRLFAYLSKLIAQADKSKKN